MLLMLKHSECDYFLITKERISNDDYVGIKTIIKDCHKNNITYGANIRDKIEEYLISKNYTIIDGLYTSIEI